VAESPRPALDRRWVLALLVVGVLTRLAWVLWVHPPQAHVRSDMSAYVGQAQDIANLGEVAARRLPGFRPFGTGWLLGAVLWVVGATELAAAGLVQAVVAGLAPVLTTLLGVRTLRRPRLALAAGVAVLAWFPGLSLSGYFLSEPWYTTLLLASAWLLVRALQGDRGALLGGVLAGVAFWVRPEVVAVFGLAAVAAGLAWRTLGARAPLRAALFAAPLLAAVGFGFVRHHAVTDRWGTVADTGALNLAMGRCHLIRMEAYKDSARKRVADNGGKRQGWWIDLPGFRQLRTRRGAGHVLGYRPSLADWRISYVGRIDDPAALHTILRRCLASDSGLEQARKSLVNAHLLWAMDTPWPETDQERGALRELAGAHLWAAIVLWLLALPAGARWLWGARRDPGRAVVALAALSILLLAAVVFGTPRLRTPYDPFAFLLAVSTIAGWFRPQSSESPAADTTADRSTTQS
jgi:hypothetical protein